MPRALALCDLVIGHDRVAVLTRKHISESTIAVTMVFLNDRPEARGRGEGVVLGRTVGEHLWASRDLPMAVAIGGAEKLVILDGHGELGLATATREGLTVHSRA
ncbi:MAG: hypothetical protein KJ749_05845, partial [Planctomycetes bacterium]|nr:hypothetical protein [Planctomycetota bacterium]